MPLILAATRAEASELCARFPRERVHCIGVGKVASALAAQRIIFEQRARAVLLAGVSGGVAPWLRPLDTVIADAAVQWDVDLTAINGGPRGRLNDGRRLFAADPVARRLAEQAARKLGFRAFRGCVASGDSFVADRTTADWIHRTFEAQAVDVETAAVAQAASDLGVPFLAIRVISDHACSNAPGSYGALAETAARRASRIAWAASVSWSEYLDSSRRRLAA